MALWTYNELKQLYLATRKFIHNRSGLKEVKEEVRWLDKKLTDRVEEILEGLMVGDSSPLTGEELEELLAGEEPEVIEEVARRLKGEANGG